MSDDLYERDFYAWAKEQASALRARRFGDNVLEVDRVAEEIEDLADAKYDKAEGLAQRIVEHFYKLSARGNPRPHRHWLVEIVNFREALERAQTPTIRRRLEQALEQMHRRAFRAASRSMMVFEPDARIDAAQRWRLEEIEGAAGQDPFDAFLAELPPEDTVRPPRPH